MKFSWRTFRIFFIFFSFLFRGREREEESKGEKGGYFYLEIERERERGGVFDERRRGGAHRRWEGVARRGGRG